MNALIMAAGSAEAALMHLWKEKQSASTHNGQLWRLVEKQRTMILGLNKDLERALKDKERYRKKLKEHLAAIPPVPYAAQKIEPPAERDLSQSPANSEKQDEFSIRSNSAQDRDSPQEQHSKASPNEIKSAGSSVGPSPVQPNDSVSNAGGSLKGSGSAEPSPIERKTHPSHNVSIDNFLPIQSTDSLDGGQPSSQDSGLQHHESVENHRSPKSSSQAEPPSGTHSKTPSLSITHATPVLGSGGFAPADRRPSAQMRKAPPAPLNLSQQPQVSSHLKAAAAGDGSDDDGDDDDLDVHELPEFERGRRKTREDDDRVREAIAIQEQESRSRSTKKKKSKSKSKSKPPPEASEPAEEPSPPQPNNNNNIIISSLASSPLLHSGGLPGSPRLPVAPNSLNAMLSPSNSEVSTQRSIMSPPLMSPGLPMSPRPGDRPLNSPNPRQPNKSLMSPPMSPRGGLPLSPRAPKQAIPLPPTSPLAFTSPHLARAEAYAQQAQQEQTKSQEPEKTAPTKPTVQPPSGAQLLKPPSAGSPDTENANALLSEPNSPQQIYRGLMSEQYPGLLLPPNALPSIQVKVFSSRMQPSRHSFLAAKPIDEDPVFILAIYARSDGQQLWRNEKTIHALPALDQQIRALCEFAGKLPDRSLFNGHAPAKIDARRAALNTYFDTLLDTPMNEMAALVVCEFLSTDVIGADKGHLPAVAIPSDSPVGEPTKKARPTREGYLTKRGKNFGGWKARYFVLDGPDFKYYESHGGAHLGTIKLVSAQIGKQSQQQANQSPSRNDDMDNQYRHAFLILEPKRKDSSSLVRHVLCAESDEERDAWVEALLAYVDYHEEGKISPTDAKEPGSGRSHHFHHEKTRDGKLKRRESPQPEKREQTESLQGHSYEKAAQGEAPTRFARAGHGSPRTGSFGESMGNRSGSAGGAPYLQISGPTNGAVIQDASMWGNKSSLQPSSVKDKKRSIFAGFRGRSASDSAPNQQSTPPDYDMRPPNGQVFGIPLQEAVEYTQPYDVENYLPAVVYRCLEYLQAKGAEREEGIFRLSGSNIVIKALRERFNNEGDVRLLDGQYYDVHAVASLLKLYLRELPTSILTRDLHLDFLKVLGMCRPQIRCSTPY
jgi:RalA-binding protein 1